MPILEPPDPARPADAEVPPAGDVQPVVVKSSTPEDLLALAAHTLGFWPSESLLMISLRGPRLRSGLVARVDLDAYLDAAARPALGDGTLPVDHLVDQLLPAMVRDGARAVAVLIATDVTGVSTAHAAVVAATQRVVARHGIHLVDAVLLGADRRWSLTCSDGCCPAAGTPVDLRASRVAAEGVLAGSAPARTRQDLVTEHLAALEPATGEEAAVAAAAVARRELASGSAFGFGVVPVTAGDDAGPARAVMALWWRLVGPDAARQPVVDPLEGAELLLGLTDLLVRDALMVSVTSTGPHHLGLDRGPGGPGGGDAGRARTPRDRRALLHAVTATLADCTRADGPGDDAVSERAAAVLTVLCRTAPRHLRAAPLALLAYVHWWRANTLAAEAAAEAAVAADPGHSLGELVTALLERGVAPDWLPRGDAPHGSRAQRPRRGAPTAGRPHGSGCAGGGRAGGHRRVA